jgi:uncharacterized protein (UPF0548 family)
VGVHLRKPTDSELSQLLADCASDDLTYQPTGGSLGGEGPAGLMRRSWATTLGGTHAYERAVAALSDWAMHKGAGLAVVTDGPVVVGTNVALSAPLPVGFVDATCRIVALVDEPRRFGFAYGTLSVHPERGEEAFVVSRSNEAVRFDISAVSRPVHPLARVAPPVANRLQVAAVRRYMRSIERLTGA